MHNLFGPCWEIFCQNLLSLGAVSNYFLRLRVAVGWNFFSPGLTSCLSASSGTWFAFAIPSPLLAAPLGAWNRGPAQSMSECGFIRAWATRWKGPLCSGLTLERSDSRALVKHSHPWENGGTPCSTYTSVAVGTVFISLLRIIYIAVYKESRRHGDLCFFLSGDVSCRCVGLGGNLRVLWETSLSSHTEAGGLGSLVPAIAQASQGAPVPPTLFPPLLFGTLVPQGSSSVAFVFLECI